MGSEQRCFFRCPMPAERSVGRLVIGSRRFRCVVQNVSIGGFGVEAANHPVIAEAENALLQTREGVFPVRIVHASEHEGKLAIGLLRIEATDKEIAEERTRRQRRLSLALTATIALFFGGTVLLMLSSDSTPGNSPASWWGKLASQQSPASRGSREGGLSSTGRFGVSGISTVRPSQAPLSVAPTSSTFPVQSSATVRFSASSATSVAATKAAAGQTSGASASSTKSAQRASVTTQASTASSRDATRAARSAARPARVQLAAAVTDQMERLSDAAHRNPSLRQQAETLNQLLTEAAKTTAKPSGQIRTVSRDGVRVEYRADQGVVEIVRVEIAPAQ